MLTELDLMKTLRPHPHVVDLIGCCIEKGTGNFDWLLFLISCRQTNLIIHLKTISLNQLIQHRYILLDPLLIVLEYLPYGDLLGYLRKSRGIEDTYNTGEKRPSSTLTEKDLLSFAWMIADGMNYLSTIKVEHTTLILLKHLKSQHALRSCVTWK